MAPCLCSGPGDLWSSESLLTEEESFLGGWSECSGFGGPTSGTGRQVRSGGGAWCLAAHRAGPNGSSCRKRRPTVGAFDSDQRSVSAKVEQAKQPLCGHQPPMAECMGFQHLIRTQLLPLVFPLEHGLHQSSLFSFRFPSPSLCNRCCLL